MPISIDGDKITFPNGTQQRSAGHPPVRQTVLSGPVDSNGLAAFGGSTGSTTVTATGTLMPTAANGFTGEVNRSGLITNPSWTGLSTNGTMYLYLDVNADLSCTTGSTTLAPSYVEGNSYSTTLNQFTFSRQEMTGKVGNGSSAVQTFRVFVGEVTVAGGVVTAIVWYALMGRYDSGFTQNLPAAATAVSRSSNLGVVAEIASIQLECTSAELGFSVGDRIISGVSGANATYGLPLDVYATRNTVGFTTGPTTAFAGKNKTIGTYVNLNSTSWKYKFVANRGW